MQIAAILTAIVSSDRLRICVSTLRQHYPVIAIYIAAQGVLTPPIDDLRALGGVEVLDMPFDAGVCSARNALLGRVREPYVLVCDDDFAFTTNSGIADALDVLQTHPNIWVVGGRLKQYEYDHDRVVGVSEPSPAHNFILDLQSGVLVKYPVSLINPEPTGHCGRRFYFCDMVLNYCLMRKETFAHVLWDEEFKNVGEHADFFLSLKRLQPGRVAYYEGMYAEHHRRQNDDYRALRFRLDKRPYFHRKHGIRTWIRMPNAVDVFDGTTVATHPFLDALAATPGDLISLENFARSRGWRRE